MRHVKAFKSVSTWILALLCAGQLASVFGQASGNILTTQRWRENFSLYSPLSNPAFLTEENYIALREALFSTMMSNSPISEAGVTVPIGLYQSIGLTWVHNGATLDTVTDLAFSNTFQNDFFLGSYAINLWKGLSVGANITAVSQNAFSTTSAGAGFDLGLSYRLPKSPILGNHLIGLNFQNLVPPVLIKLTNANDTNEMYSQNIRLTWHSTYWEKRIESNFDYCLKNFYSRPGLDYVEGQTPSPAFNWEFNGRVGFTILKSLKISGLFGFDNLDSAHLFKYFGIVLGVNIPAANRERDLTGAYQYTSVSPGQVGNTFYVRAELGRHREDLYARKMARSMDIAPNEIYLKALKLYSEGKFWDAYFLFSQIMNDYPDFFKTDWVLYYAGSCQENLDMRENALFSYQSLKGGFPQSNATANADLGMMRLYYRNEDFSKVTQQFSLLDKAAVPDSLKYTAYFILGQTHMAKRDFSKAYEVLSAVPVDHVDYLFAQHSAAIALLSVNRPMDAATHLKTCIDAAAPTLTPAQKEIVNRSNLFLAYILYEGLIQEDRPLSKAVTVLRKIPQGSIYYNEGLLLLGWTAVKAHQGADCLSAGKVLQTAKNPLFHFEGALIEAYGHMMQREYDESKSILEDASRELAVLKAPTDDSLALEKQRYIGTRTQYDFLSKKVSECAQKQQAGPVLQENSTLHDQQRDLKSKIDVSIAFFDWYKKESFLTRNVSSIKEDITYLLAVVSKRASDRGNVKEINKMINKTKDIDKEIEKLKGKLDNLDKDKKK
jgi:tetratricopeptide (TPR) repeat protein